MIEREELMSLVERVSRPSGPVLSVYLDTNQSEMINVERAFETVLKKMLRDIRHDLDKDARQQFDEDAEPIQNFVKDYVKPKRGLIIFSDASEKFFEVLELNVRVRSAARWDETPYVRPLIELMDEYERYGVVVTDKQQARLFTVYLGEIQEHEQALAVADVTHRNAAGMDHLLSQMNVQRKAEVHAHWHLKKVAELITKLADQHDFDRLILGGPHDATTHLENLLPARMRERVVRHVSLSVKSGEALILEESLKVELEVEREREAELVGQLITSAHKHQKAVIKLGATLRALQEWRIWQLVYLEDLTIPGGQCTNCKALFAGEVAKCDYCEHAVKAVPDLIERADTRVLEMDGKVEQVRGAAAQRLEREGNIGAFLRY